LNYNPDLSNGSIFHISDYLTDVIIPNYDTTIGIRNEAFAHCKKLASVTISNSVNSIGNRAFWDCNNLASVTFEGTITSSNFDNNAFEGLGNLRSKFYESNPTNGIPGTYTTTAPVGYSSTWTKKN